EGILGHGRRRPCPGARPRARAVALDWGIFSQHFRGAFIQPLQESEAEEATGMSRGNIVEQGLFFGEVARAGEASLFEDRVVLGEMFYREIMEHGVPLLDRAIRELRDRSMAIDVYVWLAYKLHVLQGRTPLRWPALYAQFGAGFATIKNFRPSFLDALSAATAAYPDAVVTLEEEGIALHPSPPPIPYRGPSRARRITAG
ncbi:replication protein RepA, partial [Dankookia sp. GCM10030260]|uniref:replication protein RepA n=1 Tax=Dankookia sp. GCM10030260 TaxID=3273390 RepID=UPI00360994E5